MKFIIVSVEFNSEGAGKYVITPDYWLFTLKQVEKPPLVNSITEIILLKSDNRAKQWLKAFQDKKELEFTITF